MSNKIRNKKHCASKRAARLESALLKDYGLVYVAGACEKVSAFNKLTLDSIGIRKSAASALQNGAHFWSGVLIVTGRDDNGKEYVKTSFFNSPDKCKHSSIVNSLRQTHIDLIKSFNKRHQLTACWLMYPYLYEPSDGEIMSVITKNGAFDFNATHESALTG